MRRFLFHFFFIQLGLTGWMHAASTDYSIVFVHIGPELPGYLDSSATQARLFNEDCPIYLIANEVALQNLSETLKQQNLTIVTCESLVKTSEHQLFLRDTPGGPSDPGGFWRFTSERFLYLDDFIQQYKLSHVFHLENDVMLYADLEEIFPVFQKHYPAIAATFDHDKRCVPGFFYYANSESSHQLAACFAKEARHGHNDMGMIPWCRSYDCPSTIDLLPIVPDTYKNSHPLVSAMGYKTSHPELYSNHFDEFQSIFDAATIGQYFCSDPSNRFVNESCLFNPSFFEYEWIKDTKGRKVPFIIFEGKKYRLNNMHIHCKQLNRFTS